MQGIHDSHNMVIQRVDQIETNPRSQHDEKEPQVDHKSVDKMND